MNNKVLYFGNFNFKTGFSSINRALGISKLFFDSFQMEALIFCKDYDGSLEGNSFLASNKIKIKENGTKTKLSARWYENTIVEEGSVKGVVLYDFPFALQCEIYKFCKRRKIFVISDITEWYDTKNTPVLLKLPKKIDVYLRMNFVHRHSSGLIAVSDYLYRQFLKKMGRSRLIKIYPTADFFLFEKKEKRFAKKSHGSTTVFCYCGNSGRGKDRIGQLIQTFDGMKARNAKLLIVGCLGANAPHCQNNGAVEFCGNLNRKQLIELYQFADYQFIVRKPTRANSAGFPTKFVESLCFDVVPVFTSVSDLSLFKECGIMLDDCGRLNKKLIASLANEKNKMDHKQTAVDCRFMADWYLPEFKKMVGEIINEKSYQ